MAAAKQKTLFSTLHVEEPATLSSADPQLVRQLRAMQATYPVQSRVQFVVAVTKSEESWSIEGDLATVQSVQLSGEQIKLTLRIDPGVRAAWNIQPGKTVAPYWKYAPAMQMTCLPMCIRKYVPVSVPPRLIGKALSLGKRSKQPPKAATKFDKHRWLSRWDEQYPWCDKSDGKHVRRKYCTKLAGAIW